MNDDYFLRKQAASARKSSLRPVLGAVAIAFLVGMALMGWIASENGMRLPGFSGPQTEADGTGDGSLLADILPTPSPSASVTAEAEAAVAVEQASQAVEKVEQVAQQTGGLDQRLAGLEQRISNLDLQIQAATGNAARAEGLLIAFASRRRIERGDPLGYLEDQLKLRFGDARPNAVATVISAAENPVTLDQLLARLDGLAPRLANPPASEGGFEWIRRELGELFVVRRETAPSPQPQRRLDRARLFLESGRTDAAIAEVSNLPGAAQADQWITDATRYSDAQIALDLLETTAVLEPRELRDGNGNKVEQRSPAD